MKLTKTLAERRKETDSDENVVASVEIVIRADLHDSVETDFVRSILGRITAEPESGGREDAGHIGASLVQFGEALDHGIRAERLGDGISGDISEYWEHLFDVETDYPKEEIQDEFEVVDLDLLIIDYVAIYPEYRGLRIAESANFDSRSPLRPVRTLPCFFVFIAIDRKHLGAEIGMISILHTWGQNLLLPSPHSLRNSRGRTLARSTNPARRNRWAT
jgi:hypothetical protein